MCALEIQNLSVEIADKNVINNLSLSIADGEIHVIVGQNGAGKSSLAKSIVSHPDCKIVNGSIKFNGTELIGKLPDEIAKNGIFMAFQQPYEIEGVSVANFIREAIKSKLQPEDKFNAIQYYTDLHTTMTTLSLDKSFSSRSLNVGFSGGEKKRCEMLQMLMLKPKFVILDEIDSGLDIDAIKMVAKCINSMRNETFSGLIITHNNKMLDYIEPNIVHVMSRGKIVASGNKSIISKLENEGYKAFE